MYTGNEALSLLLIERGADIHKLHHKDDGCPLEGAIKHKLPKVGLFIFILLLSVTKRTHVCMR